MSNTDRFPLITLCAQSAIPKAKAEQLGMTPITSEYKKPEYWMLERVLEDLRGRRHCLLALGLDRYEVAIPTEEFADVRKQQHEEARHGGIGRDCSGVRRGEHFKGAKEFNHACGNALEARGVPRKDFAGRILEDA